MSNLALRSRGDEIDHSQSCGPLWAIAKPGALPRHLVPLNETDSVTDVSQMRSKAAAAMYEISAVISRVLTDNQQRLHENSSASPFLRLPPELRNELYKTILGDRLIHVRHAMGAISSKPWRHVVCQRGDPKHFRAEQHRSLNGTKIIDDWEPQHRLCKWETYYNPDMRDSDDYWDDERMHLPILRCCRQMYIEANQILWSTNTFSIHDHKTLQHFMEDRNVVQKSRIRTLRLRIDLVQSFLYLRQSVLTPEFMHALPSIRRLELILEDAFDARLVQLRAMTGKSLTETGGNRMDAGLAMLSLLPLKSLDVIVLTSQRSVGADDPWTDAWKTEYAENVRNYILGRQGGKEDRFCGP